MEEKQTGERIRSERERKAWTQQHLASAARISPRTVQRAEEGVMSAETRSAIAGALNLAVESLAVAQKPPEGWPRIAPVLCYEDSKAAVPWLERAFGFHVRAKMTGVDGQVLHAELVFNDGVVVIGNVSSSPRWGTPKSLGKVTQFLCVFVDDLDAHYARATAGGAAIVTEPETSYGQRRYRALDLEGHEWCFSTEVRP